jgi:acid phosphatase family membrane protein YuiD
VEVLRFSPWLTVASAAWMLAQLIKVVLHTAINRKFDASRLIDTGGMPSSHTAFVSSLSTSVAWTHGLDSALFAITLCFSLIVIYDATNLRRNAGHQAQLLNELVVQLLHGKILHEKFTFRKLRELLGHNPSEVFVGAILGVGIAVLLHTTLYATMTYDGR